MDPLELAEPDAASTPIVHPSLVMARSLDPDEITELAQTYRKWRGVLAAAAESVLTSPNSVSTSLARRIIDALTDPGRPAPAADIEDAAMALWLHAAAGAAERHDATTELLREPWRTFNARRTGDQLQLAR